MPLDIFVLFWLRVNGTLFIFYLNHWPDFIFLWLKLLLVLVPTLFVGFVVQ
jgi:hypothetical protein